MTILTDTQAFLWFIMGSPRLNSRWRAAIEHDKNRSYVSMASLWEIAIKTSLRKLDIDMSFADLIQNQVRKNGFRILPIDDRHLIQLERLPHRHRDPFDRLIIAQSIVERIPLISTDQRFREYDLDLIP